MAIRELGHVVLYVSNLKKSTGFYRDTLGFPLIDMRPGVSVFSGGRTHHELLLIEVGGIPETARRPKPGLYHIGFKVGDSPEELKRVAEELRRSSVTILGATDHAITHSLYVLDPDQNELELYIDVSSNWKDDPTLILSSAKRLPYLEHILR